MYKYRFSIIMAVYNVEAYLREAIDSIIDQTIGMENVQLILVNDGSKDESGKICDEYSEKYPDNILTIHKENGGVSSARNEGLKHVQGRYVNFLDSDDKLTKDTLELVDSFFSQHEDEVDLVCIPLIFFEGKQGEHPLNVKFDKGTRVIDLAKEWEYAQLSFSSSFAKAECMENIQFDPKLAYAEDAQLVLKILGVKQKIGVIAEAKYMYRKRKNGEASAVQSSGKTKPWYMPYLEHFTRHSIDHCKAAVGYVPRFVQYTLMYDLQWRFRQSHIPNDLFTDEEAEKYRVYLFGLLKEFDDEVIIAQKSLSAEQKIYLLQSKHPTVGPKVVQDEQRNVCWYSFNGVSVECFENFDTLLHFIKIFDGHIEIEGSFLVATTEFGMPSLEVLVNGKSYIADQTGCDNILYSVDRPIAVKKGFKVSIPLVERNNSIELFLRYDSFTVRAQNIILGKYCPISDKLVHSHYYKEGYLLLLIPNGLKAEKVSKLKAFEKELAYIKELLKQKETAAKKAALSRILVHILRPFVHKNIWLITDKADRADDNGDAFFLYCMKNKDKAKCYPIFAVGKNSPDYERMKKYVPVIPYMSQKYKLCHLLATHTISAYSHNEISSPFLGYSYYYSDMLQNNKIVFLQHGIIKDDLSSGLNRNHKNFSLFVTSTKPEYDSVLECNYGYSDKQVILTGLPRYDRLYNDDQKKITIMPTWRRNLFGTYDSKTSQWTLLPGFEQSDFYIFYSNLMNSEKLHQTAEKYGYQIQFLPHPTMFSCMSRFSIDARVKILGSDAVYREVYAQSSLVVTDYSSAVFDAAYLRKPVLYAHFDSNHYAEGYFDYERDGFGEVEYTLENTVDRIVEYMENGCKLKPTYRGRIERNFMFSDQNNSQRVYEKIMELDQ